MKTAPITMPKPKPMPKPMKRKLTRRCTTPLAGLLLTGLVMLSHQSVATAQAPAASVPVQAIATSPDALIRNLGAPASQDAPAASVQDAPPTGNASAQPTEASPYGLRPTWAKGDWVARTTLLLLALMSVGSWYLIVAKALEQRRLMLMAQQARAAFSGNASLRTAADSLDKGGPFRQIVDTAIDSVRQHESLSGQVVMADWLSQDIVRSVGNLAVRLQSGMSALATVGSTAPFVGLFGTVWGIYNALIGIGLTGQASIDKVAGPVGEALIMTALGLAVAVPAVLGYNWLVRRNRVAMHTVKSFGSDLHTLLLVNVERSQRAAKSRMQEG